MSNKITNYPLGYQSQLAKKQLHHFRKQYCQKSIHLGTLLTLVHLGVLLATIVGLYELSASSFPLVLKLAVLTGGVVVVARQMRALENIVHFGSHSNFTRNRVVNDRLTNLLAAWPMLQDIRRYRDFHMNHHGDFGSHLDPCRERLQAMGVKVEQLHSTNVILWSILRWMPSYIKEYYQELKSSGRQLGVYIAWHGLAAGMLSLLVSWQFAVFYLVIWQSVMFLVLPFLRAVAELAEHDYDRGNTVLETTYNNLGFWDRVLFHPAGDAWHALHHLHPTVPWWLQKSAHDFLMVHDPAYRIALQRDGVLEVVGAPTQTPDLLGLHHTSRV